MFRRLIAILVVLGMFSLSPRAFASDDSELILKILVKKGVITQQEVNDMRAEIAKEKPVVKAEVPKTVEDRVAAVEKDLLSKVGLDKISSKLKLKGRWAAGYFDADERGTYNNGSFQAPEAKIQFTFKPDDINDIIMRMSLNNATFNNVDYFYIDSNIMKLTPWEKTAPFTLSSRLGRFKVDFGEETFSNNPVESILPSNSAANASGNDEGLMLASKVGKANPLILSLGVYNGNTGTGADNNWLKAFSGKVAYNVVDSLYVSASYYYSGNLGDVASEMSIGGITAAPTGAVNWIRQMAEVDARYDFKKGKTVNPPAYCDSLAFIRGAYGHFIDNASAARAQGAENVVDREGNYAFIEGMMNITKKFYAAARASVVGLNGLGNTVAWNSSTSASNRYERYSFGVGYRLSSATILKGSYDINYQHKVPGDKDPRDNLLSLLVASQF